MSLILIGRIMGPHGIRGAVKLQSFAAVAADIGNYGPLTSADGRVFTILKLKPAKDHFIADLKEVRDRTAAEALPNTELFVAREKLPAPAEGEFYLADLIGKPVVANGKTMGIVSGIQNFGAGDLLELDNGELVPVTFASSVEDAVTVDLPEGYLASASREDQHH
jgi:16S rRNA processing protein RimM